MVHLQLFKSLFQIAGIVFLRFPPLVRAWAALVVLVNAAAIFFVTSHYGQVVILSVSVALIIMAIIHAQLGFVRLLGVGHITWIPMIPWLYLQLPHVDSNSWMYAWLVLLIGINSICLVVDIVDVARFALGERSPHYVWRPPA